jgi:predicted aspartyl protease
MKNWIILAAALSCGSAAAAPQDCKLVRIEEWPVRLERNLPIIDGEINGQKIGILLDTGAERSVVTRSAATRLMLSRYDLATSRMYGVGTDKPIEAVRIDELRIGPAVRKNWSVLLAAGHDFGSEISLILGADFFSAVDVEFDFPNRAVRLYQPKDCEGASLAYWAKGGAGEAALERSARTMFTVALNDRPMLALLDTGASVSALTLSHAARYGVTTKSPGVTTAGCSVGIGRKPVDYWSAPFESFAIGNEVIRNPTLRFADIFKDMILADTGSGGSTYFADLPQMVLGVDFLRAHRVYVARSQHKLYFTYAGGTVFPVDAAKGCQDLR